MDNFDWKLKGHMVVAHPPQASYAFLSEGDLSENFWQNMKGDSSVDKPKETYLWVFVPFCKTKCRFCWFPTTRNDDSDFRKHYLKLLKKDIDARSRTKSGQRAVIKNFSLHGGTPTVLPTEELKDLIRHCKKRFEFSDDVISSIEVSPDSLLSNKEMVPMLKDEGIIDLRIGIQTFNHELTELSNRSHFPEQAIDVIKLVEKNGLRACIDILIGFPGHTKEIIEHDLKIINELRPSRVSGLHLQLERPNTIGYHFKDKVLRFPTVDEDVEYMDLFRNGMIHKNGYHPTSTCTFAKKEYKDVDCIYTGLWRHVGVDWNMIGIGPFTFSYIDNTYGCSAMDVSKYMKDKEKMELPIVAGRIDNDDEMIRRYIIFNLQMGRLSLNDFENKFKIEFKSNFGKEVEYLINLGLVEQNNGVVEPTKLGRVFIINISRVFYGEGVKRDIAYNKERNLDEKDITIQVLQSID